MKNEKLFRAVGQIDDDLIESAAIEKRQKEKPVYKKSAFRKIVALVACLSLVIGLAFSIPKFLNLKEGSNLVFAPGTAEPVDPDELLPPLVQEEQGICINSIDKLNYYAAVRLIAETPKPVQQSMTSASYGIILLANGSDTDKKEQPPEPETTAPEETEGPPVMSNSSAPTESWENIYYYELEPDQPFSFHKVSMFQIELTDENGFLASQLGLGVVDVVISEDCIWGDSLITFRNGERFFSCLHNGWRLDQESGASQWEFSTHKYVDGFFIVKNFEQENHAFYIDMNAEGQAVAFYCQGTQNGGYHADQNVKVVSSTVITTEGRSVTIAELEEYFNTKTTGPSVGYPLPAERVWDWYHPADREKDPYFSIRVDSLGDALIESRAEDGEIYVDGEHLLGAPGESCMSFYLGDITGDGKYELCFGIATGSGIVDRNIAIFDYETRECIFTLSDRTAHDYFLFVRNGVLCVMETEYMQQEMVRTGMLIYDGEAIAVAWDEVPNAARDD